MISFTSHRTGKIVQCEEGQILGTGVFASVFKLKNTPDDKNLVCKKINFNVNSGCFPKKFIVSSTLSELRILKKLNLLEGYARNENEMYVIMDQVEGVEELTYPYDVSYKSFQALRNLHRQGIAHLDAHKRNFLVSESHGTAIDFNLASEATYINCLFDNVFFSYARNWGAKDLINRYINEMVEYALAHKYETTKDILVAGALTLSAIYGIPTLYITNIMVQKFLFELIKAQLAKEMTSKSLALALFVPLFNKGYLKNRYVNMAVFNSIQILQSCLSIYLLYCDIAFSLMHSPTLITAALNKLQDNSLYELFAKATPEMLLQSSLLYFPLKHFLNELKKITEECLLPLTLLKKETDLLFQYSPSLYTKSAWTTIKSIQDTEDKPKIVI